MVAVSRCWRDTRAPAIRWEWLGSQASRLHRKRSLVPCLLVCAGGTSAVPVLPRFPCMCRRDACDPGAAAASFRGSVSDRRIPQRAIQGAAENTILMVGCFAALNMTDGSLFVRRGKPRLYGTFWLCAVLIPVLRQRHSEGAAATEESRDRDVSLKLNMTWWRDVSLRST